MGTQENPGCNTSGTPGQSHRRTPNLRPQGQKPTRPKLVAIPAQEPLTVLGEECPALAVTPARPVRFVRGAPDGNSPPKATAAHWSWGGSSLSKQCCQATAFAKNGPGPKHLLVVTLGWRLHGMQRLTFLMWARVAGGGKGGWRKQSAGTIDRQHLSKLEKWRAGGALVWLEAASCDSCKQQTTI